MSVAAQAPTQRASSRLVRALCRSRTGLIGLILTAAVVLVAFVGPFVSPYPPTEVIGRPLAPITDGHLLGTDMLGRDAFSRVLNGGATLIVVALVSTTLAYLVGIPVGLFAGYRGGRIDAIVSAVVDVLISFPPIILVLLLVASMGSSLPLVVLAIAVLHAPRVARIVRAIAVTLAAQDYVEAAVLRGESQAAILLHELLPNAWTPILADYGIRVAGSIILFASLSYLGFGLAPPTADWGLMISENRFAIFTQPLVILVPVVLIAVLTVGISLMTDAIAREIGIASETLRD